MKSIVTILLTLFLSLPLVAADKDKPLPEDLKSLKALAEKGDARAQFQLANKFYYGEGVGKDYVQSFEWASRSAAQDNPKAKYRLASLYVQGYGIAKDADKAMALFKECAKGIRKLAEQNDALAQLFLGVMYEKGIGVERDFKEAFKWWQKAADQGQATTQYALGLMYEKGEGVEQDFKEAVKWYQKAAVQGVAMAQNNLGVMHANGQGVGQNNVIAYMWWDIAATNGQQNAKNNKSVIAKKMTPAQIAKAEELVKEMVKKNPKLIKKP